MVQGLGFKVFGDLEVALQDYESATTDCPCVVSFEKDLLGHAARLYASTRPEWFP